MNGNAEGQDFEVQLSAFTGPLDLLCHLIECRELDAAKIRLTDLISQYVAFALSTKRASLKELAEFFSLASRLILGKVRALFPAPVEAEEDFSEDYEEDYANEEESLREALERFRPYRRAVVWLACRQQKREAHFLRLSEDEGPPWYDLGDLYGLANLWWSTLEEYRQRRDGYDADSDYFMDEIPDAVPEEVLVEQRMRDITEFLSESGQTNLRGLIRLFPDSGLIVTLLALLELSRLGKIRLIQPDCWGEVDVTAA